MRLIAPHIGLEKSYNDYIAELGDEERYPYPMDLPHCDFEGLVTLLTDFADGKRLFSDMVANSTFWLVEHNEIIAVSHLRHELNDALRHMGGHIGLGVRPSYRGKGVSKKLLELTMEEAKKRDIHTLHIHCYKNNLASVNMIKSCGGLFDTELLSDEKDAESAIVQKYILKEF